MECIKCMYNAQEYFHVKALKDLLFVSNQVTQYFFVMSFSIVNIFDIKSY